MGNVPHAKSVSYPPLKVALCDVMSRLAYYAYSFVCQLSWTTSSSLSTFGSQQRFTSQPGISSGRLFHVHRSIQLTQRNRGQ